MSAKRANREIENQEEPRKHYKGTPIPEALNEIRSEIIRSYAMPETNPLQARKKTQRLATCFDVLSSILAEID